MDGLSFQEGTFVSADAEEVVADRSGGLEVFVSEFDYSVDRFFEVSDLVSSICREEQGVVDEKDLQRFSSTVTFITEWKYFSYEPRNVAFAFEGGDYADGNGTGTKAVKLPQFSSASASRKEALVPERGGPNSKDFVLNVGGSVWALDWCPRMHRISDSFVKCEFLAVAAHPPGSSYHQIGLPLSGRGLVQIWCILNVNEEGAPSSLSNSKSKRNQGRQRQYQRDSEGWSLVHRTKQSGAEYVSKQSSQLNGNGVRFNDVVLITDGGNSVVADDNGGEMSGLQNGKPGRPRKKQTVESGGEMLGLPKRKRGRPRKYPPVENGGEMVGSPKRKRGRPRKKQPVENKPNFANCLHLDLCSSLEEEEVLPAVVTSRQEMTNHSSRMLCSSNLNGSYDEKVVIGSATKKFENQSFREFGALAEVSTGNPPQQVGQHVPEDASMSESVDYSSLITWRVGTSCSKSLKNDVFTSLDICSPDETTLSDQTQSLELNSILPQNVPGYSTVETRKSQRHRRSNPKHEDFVLPKKSNVKDTLLTRHQRGRLGKQPNGMNCSEIQQSGVSQVLSNLQPGSGTEVMNELLLKSDKKASIDNTVDKDFIHRNKDRSIRKLTMENFMEDGLHIEPEKLQQFHPICIEFSGMAEREGLVQECKSEKWKERARKNTPNGISSEDDHCDARKYAKVNIGVMQTDDNILEQECVGLKVDDCHRVEFDAANCDGMENTKKHARGAAKNKILQQTLPIGVEGNALLNLQNDSLDLHLSEDFGRHEDPLNIDKSKSVLHTEMVLPRLVLCLAHMGSVVWDAKWRPENKFEQCSYRMGYLAVLLGNGSLEVWEIPLPSLVKTLYTSLNKEGSDPRFIRLKPVFRCSKLKCRDKQSIPLVIEWSPSAPCDLLLAGCHDGTIALWKFSTADCSPDTKPLLVFNADNVPIRSISWAPDESDYESSNIIVTAGGDGLKFWDLRDPYFPMWDYNHIQKNILAIDWLRDPRWIILSYDDGFVRILNLCKAASNVPATGKQSGARKAGIHSIACSPYAIWSVQASPLTGLIAYCGVDGHSKFFQLEKTITERGGAKKLSHFPCGSLQEEDHSLIVKIPVSRSPLDCCSRRASHALTNDMRSEKEFTISVADTSASTGINVTPMKIEAASDQKKEVSKDSGHESSLGRAYATNVSMGKAFPPRIVAMHRVRWNMNPGSERWLCYGGAAGLVHCQEIS